MTNTIQHLRTEFNKGQKAWSNALPVLKYHWCQPRHCTQQNYMPGWIEKKTCHDINRLKEPKFPRLALCIIQEEIFQTEEKTRYSWEILLKKWSNNYWNEKKKAKNTAGKKMAVNTYFSITLTIDTLNSKIKHTGWLVKKFIYLFSSRN